jgi:hypothetical protein
MLPGRPRLGLRPRRVAIALGASIALALGGGLGIESASASTKSRLAVSLNSDRSSAARLDGSRVNGKIYVFVRKSKALDKVDFYIDSPQWRKRPPVRTDKKAPFDFAGTASDGTARPYNTAKLADGTHTIRVVMTWADGTTSTRRGRFKVHNDHRVAHDSANHNGTYHNSTDHNSANHNSTDHNSTDHNSAGHDGPNHDHCASAANDDHCASDHIGSHGYGYTA